MLPAVAAAQASGSLFERLNLDKLRLSALGGGAGAMKPSQMLPTQAYALHSDYGEIVPSWRVVFHVTYWESRYTDKAVERFAAQFRTSVVDPSADDTLRKAQIKVSDIAVTADLRYSPWQSQTLRTYVGAGTGIHVLNGEGRYISKTFIENSLDNMAVGVLALGGADLALFQRFSFGLQARFDLLSGMSYASFRVLGSYHFRDPVPAGRP
jgi:hypothetical protein